MTFFRDKYPALDGIIHITEPQTIVTELSNILVAFQLKSKRPKRQDDDTSIALPLSDVEWILTLPIPTVLFLVDLKTDDGIYVEWLTAEKRQPKRRRKPGASPTAEPTRTFVPREMFSAQKFKNDAAKFALELISNWSPYASTLA